MHCPTRWCLAPNHVINAFLGVCSPTQGGLPYGMSDAYLPPPEFEDKKKEWMYLLDHFCVHSLSSLDLNH